MAELGGSAWWQAMATDGRWRPAEIEDRRQATGGGGGDDGGGPGLRVESRRQAADELDRWQGQAPTVVAED